MNELTAAITEEESPLFEQRLNNALDVLPDIIVVNNRYYIWKVGPSGIEDIVNHISYKYGSYIFEYGYEGVGAMALLHLMTHIQKISNLVTYSLISFDEYVNRAELYLKQP